MNSWKETTLDKITTIIMGQSPVSESYNFIGDGLPFYQGVTEFGNKYISVKSFTNSPTKIVDANSILFSVRAPVGRVNFTKNKCCIGRGNAGLIMKNGEQEFLYYLLRYLEKDILKNATGTVFDSISGIELRKFLVLVPELKVEQKAIAAVLSSLDDKIELLRKQNETLEKIAQTIFKQWFVEFEFPNKNGKPYKFSGGKMIDLSAEALAKAGSELGEIPEGWRVGKLGDEFEIIMGQSPKGETYNETGDGMIFFQGRAEFQERFPKVRLYTTEPKRIAKKFDVLVSVRAPVGDINVAFDQCCIGRGLGAVRSKYKSYCLYKIKSLKDIFEKFEADGTVFGSINKDSFSNIEVVLPSNNKVVDSFEKITNSMDKKIFNNYNQIQTLFCLRDTLLPKLMSGEVRVK
ncbi:restriction endonuclease subunit S [Candidatus Parcubacteria bacterium]|nr:restriction endonuclease subunit S [Candidatus Parcubacteria bacterium]